MHVALFATLALVALGCGAALFATTLGARRTRAELRSCRAEVAQLRARVEDLAAAAEVPDRPAEEYVITALPAPVAVVQGGAQRLSTDVVSVAVGETLVRVVSVAHGVRRALSPVNRQRIRFEMRREVKRARKQRRRDVREAQRHLRTHPAQRRDAA